MDARVLEECKNIAWAHGVAYNTVIEAFLRMCVQDQNSIRVKLAIERIHEKNTQRLSQVNRGNAARRYKDKKS